MQMQELMVMAAVAVGIAIGLVSVPMLSGIKLLLKKSVAAWSNRTKRRRTAGKSKLQMKPLNRKAVVAVELISAAKKKHRGRPAKDVDVVADVTASAAQKPVGNPKKVLREQSSKVDKARSVAEDAKTNDVQNKRRDKSTKSVKKAAATSKAEKTVDGKIVRRGRPSNVEKAHRAAEAAKIADVIQRTDDIMNDALHSQLLNLNSEQLFALAVMRESQKSSPLAAGTSGKEPI